MIITKEYLEAIKPKDARISDKYSSRIYRYLKKHKNHDMLVFRYSQDTDNKESKKDVFVRICRVIRGEYLGTRLVDIYNCLVFFNALDGYDLESHKDEEDISNYWFEKYAKIGRCLYIPHEMSWIQGVDDRFIEDKDATERTCAWCGKTEHKKTRTLEETYWE